MPDQTRAEYEGVPTRPADLADRSEAWEITPAKPHDPRATAGVGSGWLVRDGSGANPLWWWYLVSCIHLRPLPDAPPAVIWVPGATHEIVALALDPREPLPDPDHWEPDQVRPLMPPDLMHQFLVRDDEQAIELTQMVVQHVCQGNSLDSDFRGYWQSTIDDTAEHLYYGCHPDDN